MHVLGASECLLFECKEPLNKKPNRFKQMWNSTLWEAGTRGGAVSVLAFVSLIPAVSGKTEFEEEEEGLGKGIQNI